MVCLYLKYEKKRKNEVCLGQIRIGKDLPNLIFPSWLRQKKNNNNLDIRYLMCVNSRNSGST